ncbi:MAG: DUF3857 domain-containing protein [Ferruginibacter sp.]
MKLFILYIFSLLVLTETSAQQSAIVKEIIPLSLRQNAHAIVQESNELFEIKSKSKAYYSVHQVITVLDEQGKDYLRFIEYSDKFHQLQDVEIRMFDAQGNQQKKYSKKDLISFYAGDGLVTDTRLYVQQFSTSVYPVTVQFDYQVKYDGLLHMPSYDIQQPLMSVKSSSFTCIVDENADIRYRAQNVNLLPEVSFQKGNKVYKWSVQNLPAFLYEEGGISAESSYPRILIAPNAFELDGYDGNMSSWEKFGEWYRKLATNMDKLPADRVQFLNNLVRNADSDKDKARLIYEYLQQNFRYVSIQLGIGGYKPFSASFVDDKKYGDCKALSNYMQACLAAIGIKSYQALINATYNKKPVEPSFPFQGFNHVILCVPLNKDTTWLECTSNTSEFGVLGSFTENRNALLITEEGGKLTATPRSKSSSNTQTTHAIIHLNEDGSGQINTHLVTTGSYHSSSFLTDKKDDQKNYLVIQSGFLLPDNFDVKGNKNGVYDVALEMEKVPDFVAGSKMFLHPRITQLWRASLPVSDNRTKDFYFQDPFIKSDTTEYLLPAGYIMEALPPAKNFNFDYGNFQAAYNYDAGANKIITVSRLELTRHIIPADKYKSMTRFFNNVRAEFGEKLVIKRK